MREIENNQKYRKTPKGVLTNMYGRMKQRHEVHFTLQEFHQRFLNNKEFIILYDNWVKSGFNTKLIPSLDRTDCRLPYTESNTKMMTWEQNRIKQDKVDRKLVGWKPAVLQIKDGKVINRFNSQKHAVRELGFNQSNLSDTLNGKRKSFKGYEFIYEHPHLLNKDVKKES